MSWLSMMPAGGKKTIELSISADTTDRYDIWDEAGQPDDPVLVILTVETGIKIGSDNTLFAGMNTGSGWHPKAKIKIVNKGYIVGKGGEGGDGGSRELADRDGKPGEDGGDALRISSNIDSEVEIEIDNSVGEINGGGGGAGGGNATIDFGSAGGGGGAGRGLSFTLGGDAGATSSCTPQNGGSGSFTGAGSGGLGCNNGFQGANGGDWGTTPFSGSEQGTSGVAGKAIDLNGHTITWLAMGTVNGDVS